MSFEDKMNIKLEDDMDDFLALTNSGDAGRSSEFQAQQNFSGGSYMNSFLSSTGDEIGHSIYSNLTSHHNGVSTHRSNVDFVNPFREEQTIKVEQTEFTNPFVRANSPNPNSLLSIPTDLPRHGSSSNLSDYSSNEASPYYSTSPAYSNDLDFHDAVSMNKESPAVTEIGSMFLDSIITPNANQFQQIHDNSSRLTLQNLQTFQTVPEPQLFEVTSNIQVSPTPQNQLFLTTDPRAIGGSRGSSEGHLSSNSLNYTSPVSTNLTTDDDLLHPEPQVSRHKSINSKSPRQRSRSRSRSRSRERNDDRLSHPENRDKILELASPNHSNRRQQKHPSIYACDMCDKKFTRPYNLKSHKRTHNDERPFICATCGKAFARQHDKKRHEDLHTGEKRFKCGGVLQDGITPWGCGKKFARIDALGRHFRTEAGKECIRPLAVEAENEKSAATVEEFYQKILQRQQQLQKSIPKVAVSPPDIKLNTSNLGFRAQDAFTPGCSPIDSPIPDLQITEASDDIFEKTQ